MGVNVTFQDNSGLYKNAAKEAIERALEAVGTQAESHAKRNLTESGAVDTGRLRNSVTHEVRMSEDAVYIGTNVEYAPYVENGTRRMKARPYIVPAASGHSAEYRAIIENELKKG